MSDVLFSFVLGKYVVNLEAASLETGSGFSREYFSRAANPLGGPETSLRNRIPISWFIYRSEKKIVAFSEAAAPSESLCEPARNSGPARGRLRRCAARERPSRGAPLRRSAARCCREQPDRRSPAASRCTSSLSFTAASRLRAARAAPWQEAPGVSLGVE